MKNKKTRGFTLAELMFVVAFIFIVTAFITDGLVETTRIQNITGAQADMQRDSRHRLDQLMDDIHDSQLVLSDYTNGTTTYNSDESSTLILQAPGYDTSGNPLGTNDVIIYYLVGTAAPYTLYRTVIPSAGSARKAENGQKIVENVKSMSLTYYCDDNIIGDGITQTFTVLGFPTNSPTVIDNGKTLSSSAGQYTFAAPYTLTFATAPNAPDALDIIYTLDPSQSPSQVTSIAVDLKLQQVSTAFQDAAKTQTVEVASTTRLRNH